MDLAFMTLWEAGYFLPPASPKITVVEPARLVDGRCSRCNRQLNKRGVHFHLKSCKGQTNADL